MKRRMKERLRDRRGFTIVELMVTLLILVMVTGVVAGGIPVAVNAYEQAVDVANAQVLLSTTITALRNELEMATEVASAGTDGVTFFCDNASTPSYTRIRNSTNADAEPGIWLEPYLKQEGSSYTANSAYARLLVPGIKINNRQFNKPQKTMLQAVFASITYDSAAKMFTVTGLKVQRGDQVFAEAATFHIRALSVTAGS